MVGKFLYDITLEDKNIGDSGDLEFDTKEEAQADADDYIISELSNEYNAKPSEFRVEIYLGREY